MTREDVEGKDQEADDDFRNEPVYKSHIQTDLVEIKKKLFSYMYCRDSFRPLPAHLLTRRQSNNGQNAEFQASGGNKTQVLMRVFALLLFPV